MPYNINLYTAAGTTIYKITDNGSSGSITWTYTASDIVYSGPIIYNGKVYFGCNNGYYYGLIDNGSSASLISKWPYTSSSGNSNSGPWIDETNSRVIFGTNSGRLDAFNLE
jgi:hypothetical protein